LRHLDLVLDEGQYRGNGAFLAQWVPAALDSGSSETDEKVAAWGGAWAAGSMMLVPMRGLDGSLLPAAAFAAVASFGAAYYKKAGYCSAVFVEAPLALPARCAAAAPTPHAAEWREMVEWWRGSQPQPRGAHHSRLICDIQQAHTLLCAPAERELLPLAWLQWDLPTDEEDKEALLQPERRSDAEWGELEQLPDSVVAASLEDEQGRLQVNIAMMSSTTRAEERRALEQQLEVVVWQLAELAAASEQVSRNAGNHRTDAP
jgi:hypothetical protein